MKDGGIDTVSCHIVFSDGRKRLSQEINAFYASKEPEFLGVMIKPSKGLWEYLKASRKPLLEINGRAKEYSVKYYIDVGENTIFFLTPEPS